ncbi:MAG: hypothetical protein HDT22_01845 [Ruminococcus sp.]|nr:hypothetical protein [Ruminococcus sp.]
MLKLKIVLFNFLFLITEIMIYAGKFLQPKEKLIAGLISVVIFWGVNYYFLKQADKNKFPVNIMNLISIQDYKIALTFWKHKAKAFRQELKTAIYQLELFSQKKLALKTFSEKNIFESVNQDVQNYLFSNIQKIINRMLILDLSEKNKLQMHKLYLCKILEENQNLLNQYGNFILEISQLQEQANQMPYLEVMTEALQELRNQQKL